MDEVDQIRERVDIVSFISEYVPLKKMGRNFKANCPFHTEKTPSFVVSPERQIWHCFGGCNKGGDVFTFLMEYEKLEFIEALRILAKRTGVKLRESGFDAGLSSKKEIIYKLNKNAMDYYHFVLTQHDAGRNALKYLLEKRKLNSGLIKTFMLGFSPKDGTSLSNYLINKKKYKREDLVEAGLAFFSGSRVVDFFRNRVMFPLFDHRGNVVGFSGRATEEPFSGGKYINTRETLVYHKGNMFFGLNTAKDEIKKEDKVIIVEGELDTISCFSIGIKNVVAVKGTALTEHQVALIKRFTNNICICFDKDNAGYEATKKSLVSLEKNGVNITTCSFGDYKDADEAIKADTIAFKKFIKRDFPVYDYIFDRTFSSMEKDRVYGKKKIATELLPMITKISNEIVKEHYIKRLAGELDVSLDAISREIEKIEKKEVIDDNSSINKSLQSLVKRLRENTLEEYLMALIIQSQESKLTLEKSMLILKDYKFNTQSYQKIIDNLQGYFKKNSKFDARNFLNTLPKELVASFDASFLFPIPKFEDNLKYEKEIVKIAGELRVIYLKKMIKEESGNIEGEDQENKSKKLSLLEKELSLIIGLLGKT